jgi:shikimate dehydrogenase
VYVLKRLGAKSVTVISRGGEDNYDNLEKHEDAEIIVNTTPLGMYPKNGVSPVELSRFSRLTGAIDLVYNPEKTAFLLQAERLGVRCIGGLYMLVAQAARASELFTGKTVDLSKTDRAFAALDRQMRNIILVGMPGCGKSTVGRELGALLCREVLDADDCFTEKFGRTPAEVITTDGEARFRELETEVLREITARSGVIICSGGGAVTVKENHDLLRQNGRVVFINRDISLLDTTGRPLSVGGAEKIKALYDARLPLYRAVCDLEIVTDITSDAEKNAKKIAKMLGY